MAVLPDADRFTVWADLMQSALGPCAATKPQLRACVDAADGWANIVTILRRPCTNGERLYVTAATGVGNDGIAGNRGTATNPDLLGFEGSISDADIRASWGI